MVDRLNKQHLSVVSYFFRQLKQPLNPDLIADEVSIATDAQMNEVSVIIQSNVSDDLTNPFIENNEHDRVVLMNTVLKMLAWQQTKRSEHEKVIQTKMFRCWNHWKQLSDCKTDVSTSVIIRSITVPKMQIHARLDFGTL